MIAYSHLSTPHEYQIIIWSLAIVALFIVAIIHTERKLKDEEIDYSLGWRNPDRWL